MLLEVIGFLGIIIVVLVFFAEQKKPFMGFVASVILMLLSFWILSDGIQIRSGELKTLDTLQNTSGANSGTLDGTSTPNGNLTSYAEATLGNATGLTVVTGTETTQYVYAEVPDTPWTKLQPFLGLLFLLLSVYGLVHYTFMFRQ